MRGMAPGSGAYLLTERSGGEAPPDDDPAVRSAFDTVASGWPRCARDLPVDISSESKAVGGTRGNSERMAWESRRISDLRSL